MNQRRWLREGLTALWTLAVLACDVGAATACSDRSAIWEWDRCWLSVPRWLLLGAASSAAWFVCFHRLFPRLLAPDRNDAPTPSTAFRRCLALFVMLVCAAFVLLFAVMSDELSGVPSRTSFLAGVPVLNRNWKWLLVLVAGGLFALAIWAPGRKSEKV